MTDVCRHFKTLILIYKSALIFILSYYDYYYLVLLIHLAFKKTALELELLVSGNQKLLLSTLTRDLQGTPHRKIVGKAAFFNTNLFL